MLGAKYLVTGGARSGKSRHALAVAQALGSHRVFIATAQPRDDEMRMRIARHRAERGAGWETLEVPLDVPAALQRDAVVVLDCLTLWVSNLLEHEASTRDIEHRFSELVETIASATHPIVVVTNEVGMGIVPMHPLARRFRDLSGGLSARVAAAVDHVVMMCAGLPLAFKGQAFPGVSS